jgi:hypothetical protein
MALSRSYSTLDATTSSANSAATVSALINVSSFMPTNVRNISSRSSLVNGSNISVSIKHNPRPYRHLSVWAGATLNSRQPLSGRSAVERYSHERLWTLDGQRQALFGKNHNGVADEEVRMLLADSDAGLLAVVQLRTLAK